jgi:hypothetical protein
VVRCEKVVSNTVDFGNIEVETIAVPKEVITPKAEFVPKVI